MTTGHDIAAWGAAHLGKKYNIHNRFGPTSYDCSGFVYVACRDNGLTIPNVSWTQARYCRDNRTLISETQFLNTPGALGFRGANKGYDGKGPNGHVVISAGNGKTYEARGRAWGTGSWKATGRGLVNWGLIPGVDYGGVQAPVEKVKPMFYPYIRDGVAASARPQGDGGWIIQRDGGVITFGAAQFHGSVFGLPTATRPVDLLTTPSGAGYWILFEDGSVFTYGDAQFYGAPVGHKYWARQKAARLLPYKRPDGTDAYKILAATGSGYGEPNFDDPPG